MHKGTVDVLRVKTRCDRCGSEIISDGNTKVTCYCGLTYRVESSVKITTQEIRDDTTVVNR
jgi:tRNA(Ile2) C34 agmatinyltransferase TiaS